MRIGHAPFPICWQAELHWPRRHCPHKGQMIAGRKLRQGNEQHRNEYASPSGRWPVFVGRQSSLNPCSQTCCNGFIREDSSRTLTREEPIPQDQLVLAIVRRRNGLPLQALKDDRQDSLTVLFREVGYGPDERTIGALQFGIEFLVRSPPLRQDCCALFPAQLSDRTYGPPGAIVVGGCDQQTLSSS